MSEKDSSGVRDYFLDGIINPNIYMKPEVHKSAEDREVVENRRNACYFCCKGGEELLNDEGKKLMKCSGCGDACYCSKTCQRSHWKDHKKFCGRVQKMQNTSGKEKLVNFHNENDDGIFKIFTSMFGSTKNTSDTHVAVVNLTYNNSTCAFRIVGHKLVPDKEVKTMFPRAEFPGMSNVDEIRKELAREKVSRQRTTTNKDIVILQSIGIMTLNDEVYVNSTLFVPPKKDFRSPLYYIRCINFLDPDYESSKQASEEGTQLFEMDCAYFDEKTKQG